MDSIKMNIQYVYNWLPEEDILKQGANAIACNRALYDGSREGSDFLGWVRLPSSITDDQFKEIESTAESLRSVCDVVVVVGIGGSYLGARAVIDALNNSFDRLQTKEIIP